MNNKKTFEIKEITEYLELFIKLDFEKNNYYIFIDNYAEVESNEFNNFNDFYNFLNDKLEYFENIEDYENIEIFEKIINKVNNLYECYF